jgi:protein ImuA
MPHSALQQLLDRRQLWHARRHYRGTPGSPQSSTGFDALDKALHSGNWPHKGSTELLSDHTGIGELSLLLPRLTILSAERPVAWLNPPWLPFPVFLEQQGIASKQHCLIQADSFSNQLWATEELLRSGAFSAVLSWFSKPSLQNRQLRRLHIAAIEGDCWHLHFRPGKLREQASPAPLRLLLRPAENTLHITIAKQPGGHAGQQLLIPRPNILLQQQPPVAEWAVYQTPPQAKARLRLRRPQTATLAAAPSPSAATQQRECH